MDIRLSTETVRFFSGFDDFQITGGPKMNQDIQDGNLDHIALLNAQDMGAQLCQVLKDVDAILEMQHPEVILAYVFQDEFAIQVDDPFRWFRNLRTALAHRININRYNCQYYVPIQQTVQMIFPDDPSKEPIHMRLDQA